MRIEVQARSDALRWAAPWVIFAFLFAAHSQGQANSYERTFPQSKAAIERALASVQSSLRSPENTRSTTTSAATIRRQSRSFRRHPEDQLFGSAQE
jgi:hypothetical protein